MLGEHQEVLGDFSPERRSDCGGPLNRLDYRKQALAANPLDPMLAMSYVRTTASRRRGRR